jgi:hypothetical protein
MGHAAKQKHAAAKAEARHAAKSKPAPAKPPTRHAASAHRAKHLSSGKKAHRRK